MIRLSTLILACCLVLPAVFAQQGAPVDTETSERPGPGQDGPGKEAQKEKSEKPQDARAQVMALLKEQGVTFDSKRKRVRAEGKVNVTADFLEFVAIGPRGKKHESLVMLRCLGSTLNTALALLGLENGKNVQYEKIEPLPTQEQVEQGAPLVKVIPPEGPRVYMALQWKDKDGKPVVRAIEDLILDVRADSTLQDAEWIYFGGRMVALYRGEPPVFITDYEQNYVSTYYAKPDNQLITVKHERGNYDDNWWPNEHLLPQRGTPCELIFAREEIVPRLPLKEAYPDAGKQRREVDRPGDDDGGDVDRGEKVDGDKGKGSEGQKKQDAGVEGGGPRK